MTSKILRTVQVLSGATLALSFLVLPVHIAMLCIAIPGLLKVLWLTSVQCVGRTRAYFYCLAGDLLTWSLVGWLVLVNGQSS